VFDEIQARDEPQLLVTTTWARDARNFEDHERRPAVEHLLRRVPVEDHVRLHGLLHRPKRNDGINETIEFPAQAVDRSGASCYVVGCIERHLVTRAVANSSGGLTANDLFTVMARRVRVGAV
jgi:hypothetical protein